MFIALLVVAAATAAAIPVDAQTVRREPERGVTVRAIETDAGYTLVADNTHFIPIWIDLRFERLTNLRPDTAIPFQTAVPAGARELPLFGLEVVNPRAARGYNLVFSQVEGNPAAARPDGYLYLFPFAHGTKHRITQGYDGAFSHFGENQYAIDFDLDEGTPVHAARDGVVVRVKTDSRRGGPSAAYAQDANLIMVMHEDGTFGHYVHLRYGGTLVFPGDRVSAGQHIGFSGNTGVSSGPHLHFDLRVPTREGRMQSIPFQFRGPRGEAIDPVEGAFHYAVHPDGPPFEMVFGADLTDADFADHRRTVPASGRIEFRAEQFDLTYALFVANGLAEDIEATIDIRTVGMNATRRLPLTLRIPARSELFVTLLRADPALTRWQYAPTVQYRAVR